MTATGVCIQEAWWLLVAVVMMSWIHDAFLHLFSRASPNRGLGGADRGRGARLFPGCILLAVKVTSAECQMAPDACQLVPAAHVKRHAN